MIREALRLLYLELEDAFVRLIETPRGGGRVAGESETHRVSSASVTDESESRERLDPLAATSLRYAGATS